MPLLLRLIQEFKEFSHLINKFNMRRTLIIISLFLFSFVKYSNAQVLFEDYFTPERLRIDLVFAGNNEYQKIFLEELHAEKEWAGSKKNLIDTFGYGENLIEVYSYEGNNLIYSKGFCSLFEEWRDTPESKEVEMAFTNSLWIPFPKEKVKVVISERNFEDEKFAKIFSFNVDPDDKSIKRDIENDFTVTSILNNGASENKVDIVFVAEGYTRDEMAKFRSDAARFAGYLFEIEPYKSRKSDFNIWAVESISVDSGTDYPQQGIWKNTIAGSNFYTFKTDRYLTAPDHKKVVQLVTNAPCDAIYVIVNVNKYGGGGIYNYYGLSMSEGKYAAEVFVHEFGHSFAGLGDEYYNSDVAYQDMYNLKTEPWEPNLTTLVQFELKWKKFVSDLTPVPTPNDIKYKGLIGVFEGGGYSCKGIYRPFIDCRMKTNTAEGFCPVCVDAINRMIDYYCK